MSTLGEQVVANMSAKLTATRALRRLLRDPGADLTRLRPLRERLEALAHELDALLDAGAGPVLTADQRLALAGLVDQYHAEDAELRGLLAAARARPGAGGGP